MVLLSFSVPEHVASILEWAQKDGFTTRHETFKWFSKQYGVDWLSKDFVVIKFKGDWL